MERTFLYFPSFSVGEFAGLLCQDYKINDKVSIKFFLSEYKKHQHPYFLISAGHNLKNSRETFDCKKGEVIVMGDSGGFQICSGVKKWNDSLLVDTFNWLEKNTDIAINLDIPPRAAWAGKFDRSLEISLKNFEYFHKNQTGATMFLNVLQGANYKEINTWYDSVSKFDFSGWSIGGAGGRNYVLFEMLATLFKNNEHHKETNKYLHILGTSTLEQFFILACLQNALNEVGSSIQVTTDSSSPGLSVAFGTYFTGMNQINISMQTIKIPKESENQLYFPYTNEFDSIIWNVLKDKPYAWDKDTRSFMVIHNLFTLLNSIKFINSVVYSGKNIIKQVIKEKRFLVMFEAIEKLVHSKNPEEVLNQYRSIFMQFDKPTIATNTDNDFFTLD